MSPDNTEITQIKLKTTTKNDCMKKTIFSADKTEIYCDKIRVRSLPPSKETMGSRFKSPSIRCTAAKTLTFSIVPADKRERAKTVRFTPLPAKRIKISF